MALSAAITVSSVVSAGKDPIASEMADEVAILDHKSGMYFGLDQVGAKIWELIQKPIPVKSIRDVIIAEYDVAVEQCEMDLLNILNDLSVHGLIDVRTEVND